MLAGVFAVYEVVFAGVVVVLDFLKGIVSNVFPVSKFNLAWYSCLSIILSEFCLLIFKSFESIV